MARPIKETAIIWALTFTIGIIVAHDAVAFVLADLYWVADVWGWSMQQRGALLASLFVIGFLSLWM